VLSRWLFRLGGHPKQTGDRPGLASTCSRVPFLHLPLPQPVHDCVPLPCAPHRAKRPEAPPRFGQPLDKAVRLLDADVEVRSLPPVTGVGHCSRMVQGGERLGVCRVCLARDHARGGGERRVEGWRYPLWQRGPQRVGLRRTARVVPAETRARETSRGQWLCRRVPHPARNRGRHSGGGGRAALMAVQRAAPSARWLCGQGAVPARPADLRGDGR
jgi:hypothetical protein